MLKFAAVTILLALAPSAHAMPTFVDDLAVIDLKTDVAEVNFTFSYPGLSYDVPDCLMLVNSTNEFPEDAVETLRQGLEVFDGDAILFPGPGRQLNPLLPKLQDRRLVYDVIDLDKYLTGLRVGTRDEGTLAQLVDAAYGPDYPGIVGLQIVRGCRLLFTP